VTRLQSDDVDPLACTVTTDAPGTPHPAACSALREARDHAAQVAANARASAQWMDGAAPRAASEQSAAAAGQVAARASAELARLCCQP
jgi:hypothetical protein